MLLLSGWPSFANAAPTPPTPGRETSGFEAADVGLVDEASEASGALEGKRITNVEVVSVGRRWKGPTSVRALAVGEPLSGTLLRRAMRELVDTGGVAQVDVDVLADGDGARVRFRVVPRRVVARITMDGGAIDRTMTLETAELAEESEVTEPALRNAVDAIRKLYRRYGYDDAVVRIEDGETDDPIRVLLVVRIEPGERTKIARRIFVIEPRYDRVVGDSKYDYSVESGDVVDEDEMLDADNALAEKLRGEGFIDAGVKHRVLRKDGHVFLYVYLATGPKYVFRFLGNRRFDAQELTDAFGLDTANVDASPEALTLQLLAFYRARGHYDVRVEASVDRSEDDAIVELSFRVHEGRLVRVVERRFACLTEDAPKGLSASDLDGEIDAILEEALPSVPLFHQVDETVVDEGFGSSGVSRAVERRYDPAATYTPEAYQRALEHLEKLLNSKGYLSAVVGPVGVIRAECDPTARGGVCRPLPLPRVPRPRCQKDARELPIPESPLPKELNCIPNPMRAITCAPDITLSIPVQLGPEMVLYDIAFEGNRAVTSEELVELADFPLGVPFSNVELDGAALRILTSYKDRGYAYATVRTEVDTSPDRTRARARFVINEHKPVIISGYEVRGAVRTDPDLVLSRLELCQKLEECSDEEKYYKRELVRRSEEQIATLGTFSSVTISLEDPDIPQEEKRVIITVVEDRPQYIEPRIGFSTGEGFKVAFEYGHRNVAGQAIGLTIRLELAYLPDFLILDSDVRENYQELTLSERLERRNGASLRFPSIGLGPRVDLVVDGLDIRDNQRDFGLTRDALIPTLSYRYGYESTELMDRMVNDDATRRLLKRTVTQQTGLSVELNDVTLLGAEDIEQAIQQNPTLAQLIRVPQGRTIAFAQRLGVTWDRRDNALAATMGTLVSAGVEHVSAFPLEDDADITSEFLKLTARGALYIPLTKKGMAIALSLAAGYNVQLKSKSETYPDRLFYLGGVSTVRGFQLDEMVPEDLAQKILAGELPIEGVGVRGGDLFVNPRAELRIPVTDIFSLGAFLDTGNVWKDPASLEQFADLLKLRYTAGAGLRLTTPIGPIAFDYGFKLVRYQWEDLGALHFSIGLF